MGYLAHHATLTLPQAKTLLSGGSVKIAHKHLKGEHGIFLTAQQAKRWQKAHAAGKGVHLRMSKAQLSHNIKGGGFLSDAWTKLKDVGKKVARKGIDKAMEHLPGVIQKVGAIAHDKLKLNAAEGQEQSALQKVGSQLVKAGLGKAQDLARIGAHKAKQRLGQAYGQGLSRM